MDGAIGKNTRENIEAAFASMVKTIACPSCEIEFNDFAANWGNAWKEGRRNLIAELAIFQLSLNSALSLAVHTSQMSVSGRLESIGAWGSGQPIAKSLLPAARCRQWQLREFYILSG